MALPHMTRARGALLVLLLTDPCSALQASVPGVLRRPVCTIRAASSCCAVEDVKRKRLEAEKLALEAEMAALEVEALKADLLALKDDDPDPLATEQLTQESADAEGPMALRSRLRWIGPYPALALSFPSLLSPSQKARQLTGDLAASGVTLDFVVDTAANTNTISAEVAGPTSQGGLELQQVGSIAGGVGAGGALGGGATYMLGGAQLADVPKAERVTFISGLVATALPVAAPAAAGLLGVSFLNSFPGGVEFCWGGEPPRPGEMPSTTTPAEASIIFFGDVLGTEASREGLTAVNVTVLPGSNLPTVEMTVNGVAVPALLDTGSPITVLNAAAAAAAGIDAGGAASGGAPSNPFAQLARGLKAAQAATRGDVLIIQGSDGPVQLARTATAADMSLGDARFGNECRPYVGELPGLAALDGLGARAGPAAVLGMDVLRTRPRLVYTTTRIFL